MYTNPVISGPYVFVTANTPSTETCSAGGTARVLALAPITGLSPRFSVFDSDRSGSVNDNDGRFNVLTVSTGVMSLPQILRRGAPTSIVPESIHSRGQTGTLLGGVEFRDLNSSPCTGSNMGRLVGGVSNTDIVNEQLSFGPCKGRVSWRQIQ